MCTQSEKIKDALCYNGYMKNDTAQHPYKDRRYEIVSYDNNWPKQFEIYASKIREIFGDVQIEHVGSTSVPGMSGKSCIDVLVTVQDIDSVVEHIRAMESVGFEYAGQVITKDSYLFRVLKDNEVAANIHVFPVDHLHVIEMLNLRDYLRIHPKEVEDYSNIKKALGDKYSSDYALYRKYKDEYMEKLKVRVSGRNA
jgi:GrpB-like predicted nucleotidyltransferase (UPF0157 family)